MLSTYVQRRADANKFGCIAVHRGARSSPNKIGTAASISTRYTFVDLAEQVAADEETTPPGLGRCRRSDDEIKDTPAEDADIVNPYRFNGKRFNGATGTYDMGFREYNPGLNRFLSRDYYNGALSDLALGTDLWNTNRYMFAGDNPITGVELDGHYAIDENG